MLLIESVTVDKVIFLLLKSHLLLCIYDILFGYLHIFYYEENIIYYIYYYVNNYYFFEF